jgi:hypothetical protein
MNDIEDWKNEKGAQDATYQDFVAPIVAGLGAVPRIASLVRGAPAIASGLKAADQEKENIPMAEQKLEDLVMFFKDKAQEIGDFPRLLKYKGLLTEMQEKQLSDHEVINLLNRIHADVR